MKFVEGIMRAISPDAPFKVIGEQLRENELPPKIQAEIKMLLESHVVACQSGILHLSSYAKGRANDGSETYTAYGSMSYNHTEGGYRGSQNVKYTFRILNDGSIETKQDVTAIVDNMGHRTL